MKLVFKPGTATGLLAACVLLGWSLSASAASPADCQAYATRVQAGTGSVAGSAGRGAVRGAAFGAIVGDSSKSARKGAAWGAAAGGVRKSVTKNEVYKQAYDNCMAGLVKY
ncbi:hypothetical protein [Dokdonella sp.]|uniref:hypothetical protein n=1 Tax=Dokdonella sp. TaxID=2291710 RepID=UPI0035283CE4